MLANSVSFRFWIVSESNGLHTVDTSSYFAPIVHSLIQSNYIWSLYNMHNIICIRRNCTTFFRYEYVWAWRMRMCYDTGCMCSNKNESHFIIIIYIYIEIFSSIITRVRIYRQIMNIHNYMLFFSASNLCWYAISAHAFEQVEHINDPPPHATLFVFLIKFIF